MGKLDGKVAIVTGAGRGMGRAFALRLASLGADVAICDQNLRSFEEFELDRRQMTAETTVEEIEALGVRALGVEADVGDAQAMQNFAADVHERWGRIDVLVCNAGGGLGGFSESMATELDLDQLHAVMDRNLLGTIHSVQAVAPFMKEQRSGKIVTVTSMAGVVANADGGYAHDGTAKAAIAMFTRYLAQDVGRYGITANALAPGYIVTGRLAATYEQTPGAEQKVANRQALRRTGTTQDAAKVVEFLTTDLSDYVTGQVIAVDGGALRIAS